MGQVLRRAAGKGRASSFEPPPPPPPPPQRPRVERDPLPRPGAPDPDTLSGLKNESSNLEERDAGYDAMLSKMVGRITTKPGGKLEMGEAFIVEKYNRPLPTLRTSKDNIGASKSTLPGTVEIQQLRQILLLYEGKSEEHQGKMTIDEIAKKFSLEPSEVQKILQAVSLPPEDINKGTQK